MKNFVIVHISLFHHNRLAIVCLLLSFTMQCVFSLDSKLSISIKPFSVFHYGSQSESVFFEKNSDGKRLLSYLEWEQKPIFLQGIEATATYNKFSLGASIAGAFPSSCGTVYDSDYINVENFPNCADEYASIKTNYTESECSLDRYYIINATSSYTFSFDSVFSLSPYFRFSYMYNSFYAIGCNGKYNTSTLQSNGYYGAWNGEGSYTISNTGTCMQLQRNSYITWIGAKAVNHFSNRIELAFDISLCPFMYVQSLDSHLLTGQYYLDTMSGFVCGTYTGIEFSYAVNKIFSFSITCSGTFIGTLYGSDYHSSNKNANYMNSSYTNGSNNYYVTSGCSSFSFEANVGLQIRLF